MTPRGTTSRYRKPRDRANLPRADGILKRGAGGRPFCRRSSAPRWLLMGGSRTSTFTHARRGSMQNGLYARRALPAIFHLPARTLTFIAAWTPLPPEGRDPIRRSVHGSGVPFFKSLTVRMPAAIARSAHCRAACQNISRCWAQQKRFGDPPRRGVSRRLHHRQHPSVATGAPAAVLFACAASASTIRSPLQ